MANEHGITLPVLGFLHEVKSVFHGKRGEYEEFIKDIHAFKTWMNDYQITRLAVQKFKERMNKVLKGHNHLILGFNAYMKHYRITLPIPINDDEQRGGHRTG